MGERTGNLAHFSSFYKYFATIRDTNLVFWPHTHIKPWKLHQVPNCSYREGTERILNFQSERTERVQIRVRRKVKFMSQLSVEWPEARLSQNSRIWWEMGTGNRSRVGDSGDKTGVLFCCLHCPGMLLCVHKANPDTVHTGWFDSFPLHSCPGPSS
jgi:hypothetical protein